MDRRHPLADPVTPAYLTLALLPRALDDLLTIDSAPATIDYGIDKVRFPSPAPVDARIRCTAQVLDARQHTLGIEAGFGVTFQAQGACWRACVTELVVIYR